jgi:PAS domain S-box-containing protein
MPKSMSTIVIIDDDESSRYTLSRYLHHAGFDVLEGKTGHEALDLSLRKPDLIILDINLPDLVGYEVCRQIKANPLTAGIPILHTSATYTDSSSKTRGLDGGADGYLTSPIDREEFVATVKALLRIREAEAAAQKLAQQWQSTFDAINDGILLLDAGGIVERCNRAATELFGKPLKELRGAAIAQLGRPGQFVEEGRRRMLGSRQREMVEAQVDERWLRITVDPAWENDSLSGGVVILRDFTEWKKSEMALEETRGELARHAAELELRVAERTQQLEESVKSLEGFCYSIAHDLRAPLRALNGFVDALLDEYGNSFDAQGQDYTRRIAKAASRMDQLIKDLLEYGRLSHQPLSCATIPLDPVLDDVLEQFKETIDEKKATIHVERPLPSVHGNPMVLQVVITNLISNALKYVARDTAPCLRIHAEEDGAAVRLWFDDNGIGIPPQYHEKIFGVFERLHSNAAFSGTGIGLAIVRKGLQRIGGSAAVISEPGQGSRFWIELPKATS